MNEEENEVMAKLQQKAIKYKNQLRTISAFNDDEYYAHILFNLIKTIRNENTNLKQALNEIREYINNTTTMIVVGKPMKLAEEISGKDILQIIDKYLGD